MRIPCLCTSSTAVSDLCDLAAPDAWCSSFDTGALFRSPSKTAEPTPLSDLLDLIDVAASPPPAPAPAPAPTAPNDQVPPHAQHGDAGVARPGQMASSLLDLARLALSPLGGSGGGRGAGTSPPKARSRALSLDGLRLGLALRRLAPGVGAGEGQGFERDALAVAALGARDERWEVRVAAARAAGEAMRCWGRTATLGLLSSVQVRLRA